LNIILVVPWVYAGQSAPHAGLALATSLSAFLNAGLLYRHLARTGIFKLQTGWLLFFSKVSLATLFMVVVLMWGAGELSMWLQLSVMQRVLQLFIWVTLGIVVYFAVLWLLGLRLSQFKARVSE